MLTDLPLGEPDTSVLPREGRLNPRRTEDEADHRLVMYRQLLKATQQTFSDIVGSAALLKTHKLPT